MPGLVKAQYAPKSAAGQNDQGEQWPLSKCQIDGYPVSNLGCPLSSSRPHIEEVIPPQHRGKYQKWKREFLATETGRRLWDAYDHHPTLTLIIRVSQDLATGASTGEFRWDASGNLTNATITLGCKIDSGYPASVYYPVLSSLKGLDPFCAFGGPILAAAKMAHEFEHVNQASAGGIAYRDQNEMAYAYEALFSVNGYKTNDPRLLELAEKMGGTPVEIFEYREHRSETQAMRYLLERLENDKLRRVFLVSVKKTMNRVAHSFQQPFAEVVQSIDLSRPVLSVAVEVKR